MLRLNLGCGGDKRDGYKNIDVRNDIGADLVFDLGNIPYPFCNGCVDEILAKDILEHFSFRDIEKLILEWNRLLRNGGKLTIVTPDLEQLVASIIAGGIKGWWDISFWLYGAQDYKENFHKMIFTRAELKSLLEKNGFRIDNIGPTGSNMVCEATRL